MTLEHLTAPAPRKQPFRRICAERLSLLPLCRDSSTLYLKNLYFSLLSLVNLFTAHTSMLSLALQSLFCLQLHHFVPYFPMTFPMCLWSCCFHHNGILVRKAIRSFLVFWSLCLSQGHDFKMYPTFNWSKWRE